MSAYPYQQPTAQPVYLDPAMVTTAMELPGYRIVRNLGVVRGIVVRSRNVFATIGAGLQTILGGNITLYSQLCAAITHPAKLKGTVRCPANLGISYAGTFYDGRAALATFVYAASGCQVASLTAAGKTKATMMVGSASAAAPRLQADLAKVLGLPSLVMAQPKSGTGTPRDGGPVTG